MLRFGDDLTEEILQYLTFEDKLRLECVSKQWQRLVFNKQFELELDRPEEEWNLFPQQYNNQLIEQIKLVLKKFSKVTKLISHNWFIGDNDVLSVFGQYCPPLKSLQWPVICEEDIGFYRMYGHKLEELPSVVGYEECKQCLEYCPNLKIVGLPSNNLLLTEEK